MNEQQERMRKERASTFVIAAFIANVLASFLVPKEGYWLLIDWGVDFLLIGAIAYLLTVVKRRAPWFVAGLILFAVYNILETLQLPMGTRQPVVILAALCVLVDYAKLKLNRQETTPK